MHRPPTFHLPTAALLLALAASAAAADPACPSLPAPDPWTGDAGGSAQGALPPGCATSFALDAAACIAAGRRYVTLQAWALDAADAGAAEPVLGVAAAAGAGAPRAVADARARGGWRFDPNTATDAASVGSGSQFVQWKIGDADKDGVWRATLAAAPTGDGDGGENAAAPLHYAIAWRCDGAPPCPAPRPGAAPCGGRGACTPLPGGGCARGACAVCSCAPRAGGAGCGAAVADVGLDAPTGVRGVRAGGVESFAVTAGGSGDTTNNGTLLVELAAASGAPRLAVGAPLSSGGRGGLPAVPLDGGGVAGRLDRIWAVVPGVAGGERVYASVAAAGGADAAYRLAATYSPPGGRPLCPADCGAADGRGACVAHGACECAPGFGGAACQGRAAPLDPGGTVSGRLPPRGWAFLTLPPIRRGALLRVAAGDARLLLIARPRGDVGGAAAPDAPAPPGAVASVVLPPGGDVVRLAPADTRDGCVLALFNTGGSGDGVLFEVEASDGGPTAFAPWLAASAALGATALAAGVVLAARALALAAVRRRLLAQGIAAGGDGGGGGDGRPAPAPGLDAETIAMFPTRKYDGSRRPGSAAAPPSADDTAPSAPPLPLATVRVSSARSARPPSSASRRSDRRRATEDGPSCVICVAEFADGDTLLALPCGHEFHAGCVGDWLARAASCPVCRAVPAAPAAVREEAEV